MSNDQFEAIACRAIRDKRCLALRYRGFDRVVEVHVVGWSSEGALIMRVWQVEGGSRSACSGWKLMSLRDASDLRLAVTRSHAPRDGFNPDDPAMTGGIICAV